MVVAHGNLVMRGDRLDPARDDVRLAWALGHKHVEQFVGPLLPGRLQALPLAWDVRAGEWFDLFQHDPRKPEDWGHWTNRGMNANAQCLFCHTTGYDKGYQPATDTYDSRWAEIGVGCEACHGPGSAHVAFQKAKRGGRDPYVGIDADRMLSTCASCHSRRVDRAAWRPGERFLDVFEPELLDTPAYYPDGQVKEELYEVVSFESSVMRSKGVRCWNCHDLHGNGARAPGNAVCRQCHAPPYDSEQHTHHKADGAGGSCIACHMPTTTYMERDPRHDHSFQRPDPELTVALGIPNACNRCHTDKDTAWAVEAMRKWWPDDAERRRRRDRALAIAHGRDGDPAAVPALLALLADTGSDAVRRASAARLLAGFPTTTGVTAGLVAATSDREALVRAGAAWALAQRPTLAPEARGALEHVLTDPLRVVRLHAALGLRDVSPASLPPETAQALRDATAEWTTSQAILADQPEAHYNLAILLASRGDVDGAVAQYREALRLWPGSIQARHNLAMLLAQAGRLNDAEIEFRALLARDPVPQSAFALGLLYGQMGRWSDAARALEQCLQEDPAYPRARYNLALALAKDGQPTRALDELERAAEDPTSRREAILTLVDLARQVHDKPRLERWVVEAAKLDPSVAENPELQGMLGR